MVNCLSEIVIEYFSIELKLTWFFKRMLLSIGIINLKIESLIAEQRHSVKKYISNLVQHSSGDIYKTL